MQNVYVRECVATYAGNRRAMPEKLESSRTVAAFVRKLIGDQPVEHVIAIAVDARNRPLAWYRVSQGGTSSAAVDTASVFRPAIVAGASGLVLVHNHPSGDATPSPEDTALTRRVVQGADLLGLRVLDHVIVGRDDRFSYLDAGMLPRGSA